MRCFLKENDNGLSPGQHQAIIWTNAGILLIGLYVQTSVKFHQNSNILIQENALENAAWKMDANCLSLNVLRYNTVHTIF